ncbi:maternal effect embryo arrest 60 [Zea mays]|uniref:Maternal effect embryo arrest 60 n=1 Tax=Zea mays TaxID=4577 RepID=A0A1D6EFW7_MAIZE|nr:maternal effect embryo arrest 60 [Zea mays]
MPTLRRRNPELHVKALEGIVSANTFFTVAVFIGITGTITPSSSVPPACVARDDIARNFFLFEILSFGFYLLSSLVAQGMKLAVTLLATDDFYGDADQKPPPSDDCEEMPAWRAAGPRERRRAVLRFAQPMMLLAAGCSTMGTFFLLLSMVDAIQLKFGILSCGIPLAVAATFALSALVVDF